MPALLSGESSPQVGHELGVVVVTLHISNTVVVTTLPPCKVENIVQSLALSFGLYDFSDYLGSTAIEKPTYKMQVVSLVAFVGNHKCSLVWQSAARHAARVRLEWGLDPYRTCAGAGRTTWSCVTRCSVSQRGWPPSSVATFVCSRLCWYLSRAFCDQLHMLSVSSI